MRAIDTNILVRLIAKDEQKQLERALAFVAEGAWISQIVLAETIWVLESVYELPRARIAATLDTLINHELLTLQDPGTVSAALKEFRDTSRISFFDALILATARRHGHLPLGSFDRDLCRLDDVAAL